VIKGKALVPLDLVDALRLLGDRLEESKQLDFSSLKIELVPSLKPLIWSSDPLQRRRDLGVQVEPMA
jgi:hypothetical protein